MRSGDCYVEGVNRGPWGQPASPNQCFSDLYRLRGHGQFRNAVQGNKPPFGRFRITSGSFTQYEVRDE
jgi:hypothetical protein